MGKFSANRKMRWSCNYLYCYYSGCGLGWGSDGSAWVKSGENQVTRRLEGRGVVRPENLVKVEDQTRLEGPGLTLQEYPSRIPTYSCTWWGL